MQIFTYTNPAQGSIGYYLEIRADVNACETKTECIEESPFHMRLNVTVPSSSPVKMLQQLIQTIRTQQREHGKHLPIRMQWDNVKDLFTMEDIAMLNKLDAKNNYCLYGAPATKCLFDEKEWVMKLKRVYYKGKLQGG